MQLLERTELLQELKRHLATASTGVGRLVYLVGEAGAGKTSIAQHLADHAEPDMRVLWGACEDLSTPSPLVPLQDLAREGGWNLPPVENAGSSVGLFEAALNLLGSQPTLAIFEDLHWADDATLDFLRFVGRRIRKTPLLVLCTARDDSNDAQGRLRRAVADVQTTNYHRVALPKLSLEAVVELANNYGRDGAVVYALTGGNPFFTIEVLQHASDLPATVRDTLLWRADKLPPSARQALNAASIFPRRVERWMLDKMVEGATDSVSACVASALLQVDDQFCSFRHEIARRAIEGALPHPMRVRLNAQALDILRANNEEPKARMVHHAIEAEDASAIADLALAAGTEAAAANAHREAARHYSAALRYVHSWDNVRRAGLYASLGSELIVLGDARGALEALEAARELYEQGNHLLNVGDVLTRLVPCYVNAGQRALAEEKSRQAIEVLAPLGDTLELAMAYARRAHMLALNDETDSALELAHLAIGVAERVQRPELLAHAHAALAAAYQWRDPSASREHVSVGLKLALQHGPSHLVARIYNNAGSMELNRRAYTAAREWITESLRYAGEHDLAFFETYSKGLLAELVGLQGDWPESERLAREAFKQGETLTARFSAAAALCRIMIRRGDDATDLLANLASESQAQRLMTFAPLLGEHAWTTGEKIDAALDLLGDAGVIANKIGNVWAAGEIEYWRSKLSPGNPNSELAVAEPFALLFAGKWSEAADAWEKLGCPFQRALALLEGQATSRDAAFAILDELGASATARRARQDLRVLGLPGLKRGPRASTRANAAGLTLREKEVLEQLATGCSNNRIAAHLGLAPKTVAHHVSAILTKLDASSRFEAVMKARQIGLVDR